MDKELKERDRAQKKQLQAAKKQWLKDLEAEPKVRCTIRNHDFINQGVPIEFTYKRIKKYTFKDGETVTIPVSVYEHINKCLVPDPIYVQDPETGQLRLEEGRKRARFTAVLEGSLSDIMKASKSSSKPTEAPKEATQ